MRCAHRGPCYVPVTLLLFACYFAAVSENSSVFSDCCVRGFCIFPVLYRSFALDCRFGCGTRLQGCCTYTLAAWAMDRARAAHLVSTILPKCLFSRMCA